MIEVEALERKLTATDGREVLEQMTRVLHRSKHIAPVEHVGRPERIRG